MRKWNSNSASLLQSLKQDSAFSGDFAINSKECVQEEDESFSKSVFKQGTEKEQKVLGMLWNPNQDELICDLTKISEGVEVQPATRRLILSTATRFFAPLGLISQVILPSWEMLNRSILVNIKIKSKNSELFPFICYFIRFVVD